jgi:hypothetical protein
MAVGFLGVIDMCCPFSFFSPLIDLRRAWKKGIIVSRELHLAYVEAEEAL